MLVWLDGRWLDAAHATIPIRDPGFVLADGVYETGRLYAGGWFRLRRHLERLARSGEILGIETPAADRLEAIAHELAARNGLEDGSLRVVVTRGVTRPTVLVTLHPIAADWRARVARGWTLVTAHTRRPSPRSVPAELKTLGRPWALLARREAAAAGADDALLLSVDDHVAEGPTWNVFWRVGDRLRTPALDSGVLDGITRAALLEIAPALGLAVEEGRWPREELDRAEELFATMSSLGLVPIRCLDGRTLPAATPATDELTVAYWRIVAAEAAADRVRFVHAPGHSVSGPLLDPSLDPDQGDLRRRARRLGLIGRIADDLAHEIKNPLNALVINLEVLRRRTDAGDKDASLERLAVLDEEVRRLNRLVGDLLRLIRPPRDEPAHSDLATILEEVSPLLRGLAAAARVEFDDAGVRDAVEVAVPADALRFALLHIGEAALRVLPPGGRLAMASSASAAAAEVALRLDPGDPPAGGGDTGALNDALASAAELLEPHGATAGIGASGHGRPLLRIALPRAGSA